MGAIGGVSFSHDDQGNQTANDLLAMKWDGLNRLREVRLKSDGTKIAEYLYDCDGKRVAKTVTVDGVDGDNSLNGTTLFYYSGYQVVDEYVVVSGTPELNYQYVWGEYLDELICRDSRRTSGGQSIAVSSLNDGIGSERMFTILDRQYNVIGVVDEEAGTTAGASFRYDPYGVRYNLDLSGVNLQTSGLAAEWEYSYTGQRLDRETGLYYFKKRYYSSDQGRFVSRDPAGYVDGMSLYHAYFAFGGMDPLGLASVTDVQSLQTGRSYSANVHSPAQVLFGSNPASAVDYKGTRSNGVQYSLTEKYAPKLRRELATGAQTRGLAAAQLLDNQSTSFGFQPGIGSTTWSGDVVDSSVRIHKNVPNDFQFSSKAYDGSPLGKSNPGPSLSSLRSADASHLQIGQGLAAIGKGVDLYNLASGAQSAYNLASGDFNGATGLASEAWSVTNGVGAGASLIGPALSTTARLAVVRANLVLATGDLGLKTMQLGGHGVGIIGETWGLGPESRSAYWEGFGNGFDDYFGIEPALDGWGAWDAMLQCPH